ncbi:MAG TPA: phosphate/phosphite/phosphonate ABC transporter substrate-binding protein [Anaeromyxobacteraceae bacterium]|nr:phosphate/phosphite/phosphonate ABC transporter substrate-binding protein [Anaeromyxobacteraceae bacterium]
MRAVRRPIPFPVIACACAALACDTSSFREVDVSLAPERRAPETPAPPPARTLRFSVAAVESPRDTYAAYARLFRRIGERLGVEIEFVQRRTYREVNDLLANGQLEAALVCTGGYLDLRRRAPEKVEIVAVPIVGGLPTYQSVVIVPADSPARTLADLAGERFAYTDELSLSGHAYVVRRLRDEGRDPSRFFGFTVFTQNHDRSIRAVASGLVDGAAVHGHVLRHLLERDPELRRGVRVLHRSEPIGAMPVVVSTGLDPATRARLREVLLAIAEDPDGAAALATLGIDRFDPPPSPRLYEDAARVMEALR